MKTKHSGIYLPFLFLAITASVTLRTMALLWNFDFEIGYFNSRPLHFAGTLTVIISAVILATYLVLGAKRTPRINLSSPISFLPSGLMATSLLYLAASMLVYAKSSEDGIFANGRIADIPAFLALVAVPLALLSVAHFFLNVFNTERASEVRAYLSIATALLLSLTSAMLYFDTALPINSPNKIVDQMALLFSALFFIYETRISLGRAKWQGYITFGLVASLLSAYSALPAIIVYFVRGEVISHSLPEAILTLSIFIFITMRVIAVSVSPEDRTSLAVLNMDAYSETKRERAVRIERDFAERYATQLSIDDLIEENTAEAPSEDTETAPNEEDISN